METITCIDKEGNSNEYYFYLIPNILNGMFGHEVKIFSIETLNYGRCFPILIYHVSDFEIKIKNIHHSDYPEFKAKGIPDVIIPKLSKLFFKDIISCSNEKAFQHFENEGRTENADKYWKRLVNKGAAFFENEKNIFRFKRFIPEPVSTKNNL